jgi:protein-disulfide isomerase
VIRTALKFIAVKHLGIVLAALCGMIGAGLATPAAARPVAHAATNWNATVARTPLDSHVLGNPDAPVKLIEYISYTCPHCAHFEQESEVQLRLGFIAGGKGSIEVRSFVRDPIDLTVALLTHCGPPAKFFTNHGMFLRSQDAWMKAAASATDAQRQRWTTGEFASRTRAIASDFHFYDIMKTRGYSRPDVDRCLADKALADRLAAHTQEAVEKDFVNGTPSFVLNGVPLSGTYNWETLRPQLEARLPR